MMTVSSSDRYVDDRLEAIRMSIFPYTFPDTSRLTGTPNQHFPRRPRVVPATRSVLIAAASWAVLAFGGVTPARAYLVGTSVGIGYYGGGDSAVDSYNFNEFGGNFGPTGAYSNFNCGVGYPLDTCSGGVSGTTSAATNLTASSSSATMSYSSYNQFANNGSYNPAMTQSGAAVANLAAGTIGVSGTGSINGTTGGDVQSQAAIADTIHLTVTGAPTNISISFTTEGLVTPAGQTIPGIQPSVGTALVFGGASYNSVINVSTSLINGGYVYQPQVGSESASGWVSYGFSPNGPGLLTFSGVYALPVGETDVNIDADMLLNAGLGGTAAYLDTGTFSMTLPGNVSFTSDSGVFLIDAGQSDVPEPASLTIFAASLGLLPLMRRRGPRSSSPQDI
jgi:hypothetical protein